MQALAQLLLGIIAIGVYFWTLGFVWGIGLLLLFGLAAVANGKDR